MRRERTKPKWVSVAGAVTKGGSMRGRRVKMEKEDKGNMTEKKEERSCKSLGRSCDGKEKNLHQNEIK